MEKTHADLVAAFMMMVWEGGEYYDAWHDAREVAAVMGAEMQPHGDGELITAGFMDGSRLIIHADGSGIEE